MMKEVLVGAKDWRQESWTASFYPEDLPEDWRMSYYANEYPTTVINLADFDSQAREDLLEQIADCQVDFHPVLKVHTQQLDPDGVQRFLEKLNSVEGQQSTPRLAGVWLDGKTFENIDAIQKWREVVNDELPIAASIDAQLSKGAAELLLERNISQIGHLLDTEDIQNDSWLYLVSLDSSQRQLAQQIRCMIENDQSPEVMCLIADKDFSEISQLQEIFTIVQLLGG